MAPQPGSRSTHAAYLSARAGNALIFDDSDGGLWVGVSEDGGGTEVTAGDGITVDGDAEAGYTVAARLSADSDNALTFDAAGALLVLGAAGEPGPPGPEGPAGPAGPEGPTGVSVDAGNTATLGTDELIYVPQLSRVNSENIQLNGAGTATSPLWAGVKRSADPGNTLEHRADGLYVPTGAGEQGPPGEAGPEGPAGPAGGPGPQGPEGPAGPAGPAGPEGPPGADYQPGDGITISDTTIAAKLSADTGNQLAIGADKGLMVPAAGGAGVSAWLTLSGQALQFANAMTAVHLPDVLVNEGFTPPSSAVIVLPGGGLYLATWNFLIPNVAAPSVDMVVGISVTRPRVDVVDDNRTVDQRVAVASLPWCSTGSDAFYVADRPSEPERLRFWLSAMAQPGPFTDVYAQLTIVKLA
jgi:hypothetical protein